MAVGVALLLVGLEHQLADLVEGLHDARLQAAVHLVVPLAEELVAGTDELRIRGGVHFPLLHLHLRLLVEAADDGEVVLPIPLLTGDLLDPLDAVPHILRAALDGILVVVADGQREREGRELEAAVLVAGGHVGAVAGGGGGDEAEAAVRQGVQDGAATFARRHRAGVRRQAVALDGVDIRDADELVELGDEEHRDELVGDADEPRETGHHLSHGHLVEEHELVVYLVVAADATVGHQQRGDDVLDVAVHVGQQQAVHGDGPAAVAQRVAVKERHGREVGAEPAVLKEAEGYAHRVAHDHLYHVRPEDEPVLEVAGSGLDALPLAPRKRYGALLVQAAELALAVYEPVPLLRRGERHEVLPLALDALLVHAQLIELLFLYVLPVDLGDHFLPDLEVGRDVFLYPFEVGFKHLI